MLWKNGSYASESSVVDHRFPSFQGSKLVFFSDIYKCGGATALTKRAYLTASRGCLGRQSQRTSSCTVPRRMYAHPYFRPVAPPVLCLFALYFATLVALYVKAEVFVAKNFRPVNPMGFKPMTFRTGNKARRRVTCCCLTCYAVGCWLWENNRAEKAAFTGRFQAFLPSAVPFPDCAKQPQQLGLACVHIQCRRLTCQAHARTHVSHAPSRPKGCLSPLCGCPFHATTPPTT